MKILQLHIGMDLMGGIESMICNLANEMIKEHEVTVCSVFKPQSDHSPFYTRLDKKVVKMHLGIVNHNRVIQNLWIVYNYIKNVNADIIHIHGSFYYYFLPIILLHRRVIFVYTVHSDAYMENTRWDRYILFFKRLCFKRGWLSAVTISPESQKSFYKLYHVKSKLILNGVPLPKVNVALTDIENVKITTHTKVFVHAGRISLPKNQETLCKVFRSLIYEGEDIVLLIVGSCQENSIFEKLQPFFCDRIKYIGERNDIQDLLYHADGFCLPSIWEGLPLTLLEALSVGCPPICSPVGGITGVIKDGVNGLLSDSYSEEDYYSVMKKFLSFSQSEIFKIKQNCIASFKPYNINTTAKHYLDFYYLLLKRNQNDK